MAQAPTYGKDDTYAVYLYPIKREPETFDQANVALSRRLIAAGFSEFIVVDGGVIPGPFWAMECHFRGTRDEIYPDLPTDLVHPETIDA